LPFPSSTSHLLVVTLRGKVVTLRDKVAADLPFWAIAISGYEFRTRAGPVCHREEPSS
jgi:hypothetical protein